MTTIHNTQTLPTVIKFELLVVGMLNHLAHTPTHLHAHLCPCAQYTAQVGARVWVGLHAHPLALLGGVVGRIEDGWYVIMAACAHSHPFVPTCINSESCTRLYHCNWPFKKNSSDFKKFLTELCFRTFWATLNFTTHPLPRAHWRLLALETPGETIAAQALFFLSIRLPGFTR